MDRRFDEMNKRFEVMHGDIQEMKVNLQKVVGMLDVNTRIV